MNRIPKIINVNNKNWIFRGGYYVKLTIDAF